MKDIQILIISGLIVSLYVNYMLYKMFRNEKILKANDRKTYLNYLSETEKLIEKIEKKSILKSEIIKKLKKTKKVLIIDYKKIEKDHKELIEKLGNRVRYIDKLREQNSKLACDYSDLEWGYEILIEAYNNNALDLHFWNLLPKADREIRRKFLKTGEYKVYNLENGSIVFEV